MDSYERFLLDLKNNLNLDLSGYKRPQMERRINSLMGTLGFTNNYDGFLREMKRNENIYNRFLNHLTINVSEFFRNPAQWQVLEKKIIPTLLSGGKSLKIWSAGCSTGEEPYTLAMLMSEVFPTVFYSILATDFDSKALDKAIAGCYSTKEIQGIPEKNLKKYFNVQGETYHANAELKKGISFKRHNLLLDVFPEQMDLIVCRNVVIYFKEETKEQLYRRFHKALSPGGILFMGSTEQIIQAREMGFESVATFFYKKSNN